MHRSLLGPNRKMDKMLDKHLTKHMTNMLQMMSSMQGEISRLTEKCDRMDNVVSRVMAIFKFEKRPPNLPPIFKRNLQTKNQNLL